MSLGKLLRTGKSLVGLNNSGARYQLQKGALPKFESSKNPFTSRSHEEPSEREPQLPKLTPAEIAAVPGGAGVPPASAGLAKLTPAELAAAKLKKTQALPVLGAKIEARARNPEPVAAAKPKLVVDGWLKKINPLVWLGSRKPAEPKTTVPRFNKAPVQGELSLDNIKVMRNDLSETDVEIVPAKARRPNPTPAAPAVVEASAAAMAIPELPPPTTAWEYLGERLLGKH
ncbi:MAG TPA: hypothetical protein VH597_17125 [Verrucomicrobiae bacterium]|jgi:hypothetical protein|nr:hypothetical protein [Verrucomicrobiae bacterium]